MKKLLSLILVCACVLSMGFTFAEDDRVTVTVAIFDRGTIPAEQGTYEDNWATRWINENAPVKVQFVPVPRWSTYSNYNLWLAGGTCPDIIMEFQPEYVQEWSSKGLIMELSDLIDDYAPNYRAQTKESVQAWGIYNGGEYAVVDARPDTTVVNHMLYVRTDWLENLGLDMPTNYDELLECIRAFTEDDPDGNGINDTYGWSFGILGGGILEQMNGCYQGAWIVENGELVSSYVSEADLEIQKFSEEIFNNGWCDKEFASKDESDVYSSFATGKLGFLACGITYLTSNVWPTLMANEPDAKVAAVPSCGPYGYYQERECNLLSCIPAACTHPEAALQYLDWMYTEGWKMVKFGEEGVDFYYDGDIIIRMTDDATYAAKFNYTQDYVILTPYKDTVASYRYAAEAMDPSQVTRTSTLIQADAMDATKDIKYYRVGATKDLGVAKYTELYPDMTTIAQEYRMKALVDPDFTAEDAQNAIKAEWAGMGYDELKEAMNEAAIAQGLLD